MEILAAVLIGFGLDCLLGDPENMPHPICLIGSWISGGEKLCRRLFPERLGGGVMAAGVVALTGLTCWVLLALAGLIHPWLRFALECVMCWQIFAANCLKREAMKVQRILERGDLAGARAQVAMLVGRDTQSLSGTQVVKATVETVAENTSDGIVAPMCWMLLGGPVLGFMYKAVNTMDSMVGYKNEKYLNFGRYPAKLDDLVNYIPARLSGLAMVAAAFALGYDGKNAWRIWRRDRRSHASPNSAQTESACAGALRVQLAGNASYFGKIYEKPTIGDPLEPVRVTHIADSCRLMYGASVVCLGVLSLIRLIFEVMV